MNVALGKGDWSGETSGETHWVWRDYGQDRAGGVVKVERLRWTLDSRLARAGKEAVQERMRLPPPRHSLQESQGD